jgi:hypothetical protein
MLAGKQADGEGMPFDLGLRDGRFSCPEDRKGLTRGTHIEADTYYSISLHPGLRL